MSNVDRPNGFRPVKYRDGSPYNGACFKAFSPSDNLFFGDLVKANATAVASNNGVYRGVSRISSAGDIILGVVVGFEPNPTALGNLYHAASSTYAVYIADVKDVVLEAQSDSAVLVQSDVGLNISPLIAAGSTTTGASNMELDDSTVNTTNTLTLRIIEAIDRPDNDATSSVANQRFYVTVNSDAYANLTVGV